MAESFMATLKREEVETSPCSPVVLLIFIASREIAMRRFSATLADA